MAASENSNTFYGNRDIDKKYPRKNLSDKNNFVLVKIPTRTVTIGKQSQVVQAESLARTQVFKPYDYEKLERSGFFTNDKNCIWTILHNPTLEEASKPEAKVSKNEPEAPVRKRRTKEEIEAEKKAKALVEQSVTQPEVEETDDAVAEEETEEGAE